MRTVSISEFKAKCLALLADVQAKGEPLLITRRGRPIARVVPERARHKNLFGYMKGTGRIVGDVVSPVDPPEIWNALRE